MSQAIVHIDGNNFYASCEQMIDPSIRGKGVVVLSNNDGCIIARSAEARKIGIPMGKPYFKLKDKLRRLNIKVRSSNYELYGDMSKRLMDILKENCEELEIYSIDEAFATVKRPKQKSLYQWAKDLRALVYQNVGIPISIGIGNTKVQSKIANHIAKRIEINAGIFDISIIDNKDYYFNQIEVDKIWGVGKRMSIWFKRKGITNARELRDMSSKQIKDKFGINGIRLQNELKGNICIPIKSKPSNRKQICVSRSFAYPIDSLEELRQAVSHYALIASAKLRKHKQFSSAITVFISTNIYANNFYKNEATIRLNLPCNDSRIILKAALEITKKIFKPYKNIIKAGVIMHHLQSSHYQQKTLFNNQNIEKECCLEKLNEIIDSVNKKYGRDKLNWSSSALEKDWSPRRNKLSRLKTTNIDNIPLIYAK